MLLNRSVDVTAHSGEGNLSMNYDWLTKAYWAKQATRIELIRQRISERIVTTSGRVVPDSDDLTLGTGRRLDLAVGTESIALYDSAQAYSGDTRQLSSEDLPTRSSNITSWGESTEESTDS